MTDGWTFDQDDEGLLFATHRHDDDSVPVAADILTGEDGATRYAHCPQCDANHSIDRDGGDIAEIR